MGGFIWGYICIITYMGQGSVIGYLEGILGVSTVLDALSRLSTYTPPN